MTPNDAADSTPDEGVETPVETVDAAEERTPDAAPELTAEEALQAEVAELKDRLLRARADYDNLVKRHARDAALERERVKARVVEGFLQVYEFGQMAVIEAEKEPGPLAEGVKMIVREFDRLLESEGVQTIGKVGEPFDKSQHEAVEEAAADGVEPGHISRVVRNGYRLGDRVLRYAKVAVAPEAA
ncbi:MAG: nucleotide exchange factor GrpE [Thermoplasmatota archaeon]